MYVHISFLPLSRILVLNQMRTLLNLLPSSDGDESKFSVDQPLEVSRAQITKWNGMLTTVLCQYAITEVWSVPFVGTVVNGLLNGGSVKAGEAVL
jgi:hypothetical protein